MSNEFSEGQFAASKVGPVGGHVYQRGPGAAMDHRNTYDTIVAVGESVTWSSGSITPWPPPDAVEWEGYVVENGVCFYAPAERRWAKLRAQMRQAIGAPFAVVGNCVIPLPAEEP